MPPTAGHALSFNRTPKPLLRNNPAPPGSAPARQKFFACRFPRLLHRQSVRETLLGLCRKCGTEPVPEHTGKRRKVRLLGQLPRQNALRITVTEWRIAGHREINDGGQREIIRRRSLRLSEQLLRSRERRRTGSARNILTGDV